MTMPVIKLAVQAYLLDLYPASGPKSTDNSDNPRLTSLSNGLALPSFWTKEQINTAFAGANKIWNQARIEFSPVTVVEKDMLVPDDDKGLWRTFVNSLSPGAGAKTVGAGFVYDLPGSEGGVGGGRIAVVAWKKAQGAIAGYEASIITHELGHILLGHTHREDDPSNLMYHNRHPRRAAPDLLDAEQVTEARRLAESL
jgi:hypothetical protein